MIRFQKNPLTICALHTALQLTSEYQHEYVNATHATWLVSGTEIPSGAEFSIIYIRCVV